jgi:hypothetical protein
MIIHNVIQEEEKVKKIKRIKKGGGGGGKFSQNIPGFWEKLTI